jgi:NAD(P)-dependent dehydrogenase (short-subunit alcohol dehydrogenase family)
MKRESARVHAKLLRDGRQKELAVCITGCDTGFGRDLACELSSRGFVVFAGCLTENGRRQFAGRKGIVPLLMDVTKESDVAAAVETVSKWMSNSSAAIPRYFHALVNNAGVGCVGMADWLSMDDYYNTMEGTYVCSLRAEARFEVRKFSDDL